MDEAETRAGRAGGGAGAGADNRRGDPLDPSLSPATLHAPWRLEYLESLAEQEHPGPGVGACFIREYWLTPERDEANHIVVRTEAGMIFLNLFPYANGHLLVALGEGRSRLSEYDPEQRAELWSLTDLAAELMERTLDPQGINIGINQGRAAGAGIPQHLHVHLVPRWLGDINYITTIGQVRVIPSSMDAMYRRYRATWERMRGEPPG